MRTNLDPQEYFKKALKTFQDGNVKEAEKMFRKLLKSFPNNDTVLNILGVIIMDKKPIDATHLLKKAVKINPANVDALVNLSSAQKNRRQFNEALANIQKARKENPDRGDIIFNEGNILIQLERFDEAHSCFLAAVEKDPQLAIAHHNIGMIHQQKGEIKEATEALKKSLSIDPQLVSAMVNLGNLAADDGELTTAENYYKKALEVNEHDYNIYDALGKLQLDNGQIEEAEATLTKSLALLPNNPTSHLLLGNMAREKRDLEQAEIHYRKVLSINPNNEGAKRNLHRVLNAQIPGWHFTMLADEKRNAAYQKALEQVVKPDSKVLDIGTGSGLLAMMAAKAGAQQVIACEMHQKLAETAVKVIADNQLSKKIKVINKKSTALSIHKGLSQKANVLVSEILDVGVIGEGVLPTVRHAIKNLLEDDAILIPAKVDIFGQLVEIPMRSRVAPVRKISGFDLSSFDQYRIPNEYQTVHLSHEEHRPLSAVFPIESFDFYNLPPAVQDNQPVSKSIKVETTDSGMVQAVAFWFDLTLHEDIIVSSRPDGDVKHWGQALFCFESPKNFQSGETISLDFIRSDQLIQFNI